MIKGRIRITALLGLIYCFIFLLSGRSMLITTLASLFIGVFAGFPLMWRAHGIWSAYALLLGHSILFIWALAYYTSSLLGFLREWKNDWISYGWEFVSIILRRSKSA